MAQLKQSDSSSERLLTMSVSVPAKAMLFGEYGVLRGGGAVTALLQTHTMKLDFQLSQPVAGAECGVLFESDYLNAPLSIPASKLESFLNSESDSEPRNLACYVSGFEELLSRTHLSARVVESFSPQLGFGTSSALLVAFQTALERFAANSLNWQPDTSQHLYWDRLYRALHLLQKKGSGYDVATQSWALNQARASAAHVAFFKNNAASGNGFSPLISEVPLPTVELTQLGCFVQTGVRSDTRRVLQATSASQKLDEFCALQSRWAEDFVAHPTALNASRLCRESSVWARNLGLLAQSEDVLRFVNACDTQGIPWKTMGAGHGDCLWVIASQERICELFSHVRSKALTVSYAFAGGG